MLSNVTFWEQLQVAASQVGKDANTVCKKAGIPASTRKDLPLVANPQPKTRKKIISTLVALGWEDINAAS
ncbi:MAG: hypothetical protein HRU09_01015 [Oligoflexales bacterium]|nr:hypothetical protein [Oligoflexales bacterium]